MRHDPLTLRLCLALLRAFAILVPRPSRAVWRREWDAEVRHRWHALRAGEHLDWRSRMDLVQRVLGALPDAAWLRRQFSLDADVVHDLRHAVRMMRNSPAFAVSAVF